jgi:hypothetical protein
MKMKEDEKIALGVTLAMILTLIITSYTGCSIQIVWCATMGITIFGMALGIAVSIRRTRKRDNRLLDI